jgi:hypothetical protein
MLGCNRCSGVFNKLLDKAVQISVDCGLYVSIWDMCLVKLAQLDLRLSHSHMRLVIKRYLESGRVSKNTPKQLGKSDVPEEAISVVAEICEQQLQDDPQAFKEPFKPFSSNNPDDVKRADEAPSAEEEGYYSV